MACPWTACEKNVHAETFHEATRRRIRARRTLKESPYVVRVELMCLNGLLEQLQPLCVLGGEHLEFNQWLPRQCWDRGPRFQAGQRVFLLFFFSGDRSTHVSSPSSLVGVCWC